MGTRDEQNEEFEYRVGCFKRHVEVLLTKYNLRLNHFLYMDGPWEGSDDLILEDTKYQDREHPLWHYMEAMALMENPRKHEREQHVED